MSDMHLEVLRNNAKDEVPFPLNGDSISGGVYRQINLDLTQQDSTVAGGPVFISDVIVLDGGTVAGDVRGTVYVPEGTVLNCADAPDLEVVALPGEGLATIWRTPNE